MSLRKGQKELVEQYIGGKCAVPAIPGGGKTYSLSVWAAEMIVKIKDEKGKILIVTYMNSAAGNFKRRINLLLQESGIRTSRYIETSTIHSLCLQILKEGYWKGGLDEEFQVIDEYEKSDLITLFAKNALDRYAEKLAGICDESKFKNRDEMTVFIKKSLGYPAQTAVGYLRSLTKEQYDDLSDIPIINLYKDVNEMYIRHLKINGMIDFDDMLAAAYQVLIENEGLRNKLQGKYTFVCEDEAQDSNLIQTKILEIIAGENFLRVGDANQSICGSFTSSSTSHFKDFCSSRDTVVYSITQSSRNSLQIIALSNLFVDAVRTSHPTPQCRNSLLEQYISPVGQGESPGNPKVEEFGLLTASFKSLEEEKDFILKKAQSFIKKYPDKTLAIIVSTNKHVDEMFEKLEQEGIPCEKLGSASKRILFTIKLLGLALAYVSHKYTENDKNELINMILEYKNVDIIKEIEEIPLFPYEECIMSLAKLFDFDSEQMTIATFAAGRVSVLTYQGKINIMHTLSDEMLSARSPFSRFAVLLREVEGYDPEKGMVTVSTYHKAKGLEWDLVIMGTIDAYEFPTNLYQQFKGEQSRYKPAFKNIAAYIKNMPLNEARTEVMSERVRLLYVGMTRAKRYLIATGSQPVYNGKKRESWLLCCIGKLMSQLKERRKNECE